MSYKKDDDEIIDGPNGTKSSTGLDENIAGLLCYVGVFVTGIVFLILEKNSSFVRFHAMQSTVLFLALWLVGMIVGFIPIVGLLLSPIIWLLSVVLWVVLMLKTYQKERLEIPVVTDLVHSFLKK